jgi:hypothetical protein
MKIRRLETGDFDEWLRMRLALWPELSAENHRSEMHEILVDQTCQTFVAVRPGGRLGGRGQCSRARKTRSQCLDKFDNQGGVDNTWEQKNLKPEKYLPAPCRRHR